MLRPKLHFTEEEKRKAKNLYEMKRREKARQVAKGLDIAFEDSEVKTAWSKYYVICDDGRCYGYFRVLDMAITFKTTFNRLYKKRKEVPTDLVEATGVKNQWEGNLSKCKKVEWSKHYSVD